MSELLNVIGLSTGLVLYAMLFAMVVRRERATPSRAPRDPLLVMTALLGLAWNAYALPAYALPRIGMTGSLTWLAVAGFSALGFLPAVVVHSVLRGESDRLGQSRRTIATAAYATSALAAVLQGYGAWHEGVVPLPFAMRMLTYAYIGLSLPVAAVTRGQPGERRALWVAALSIFAVSALHLSQIHASHPSWVVELLGHHASVPLALAILYQDYPFALADLFLKRALTLIVLVTSAFLAVTAVQTVPEAVPLGGPRRTVGLVVLCVGTALAYPRLKHALSWFVDKVVLDRPDYERLVAHLAREARREQDIGALLDSACRLIAPALSARVATWRELTPGESATPGSHARFTATGATVDIPVTETPQFLLDVRGLTHGRRLLSDDHRALQAMASILGRRIDAIRLSRERYARQLQDHEMAVLATEAELRALRSQINPHFLFNALTTIGCLIHESQDRALDTLLRLTSLLRAVLRSEGAFTTLGRELELVEAYLDIERARFEDRLSVRIDVGEELRASPIPPLILQPLVENAIKHGIARRRDGGEVSVTARVERIGSEGERLLLAVRDTGAGATEAELRVGRAGGVGLANLEQRLSGYYGAAASLTIETAAGHGTTARVTLPTDGDRPLPRVAIPLQRSAS